MGIVEREFDCEELHPIDIVETLAEERSWDFDRIADDQIAMAIEGSWRTYSVTLAWSARDETLRLICAFDMAPPARRVAALHHGDVPRQRQVLDRRLRALARAEADGLPLRPEPRRRRAGELGADQRHGAGGGDRLRAVLPGVPAGRLGRRDARRRRLASPWPRPTVAPDCSRPPFRPGPEGGAWSSRTSPAAGSSCSAAARWAPRCSRAGSPAACRPPRSPSSSPTRRRG